MLNYMRNVIIFFALHFIFPSVYAVEIPQAEVLNQQLINQYGLDFSDPEPQPDPYSLVVGSDELIAQGYGVTVGALYLIKNSDKSIELISKTLSGQPATVLTFDYASKQFDKIAYSSRDPDIVSGDFGDNQDAFIYDRSNGRTIRVEGLAPHNGVIYSLRLSPTGNHLALNSTDLNFGPVVGDYNHVESLIYIYDISLMQLSTVQFQGGGGYIYLGLMSKDALSFNHDGTKLFFQLTFDGFDYGTSYYSNEIQSNTTTRIGGSLTVGTPVAGVKAIGDSHLIFHYTDYDFTDYAERYMKISIYNVETGVRTFPGFESSSNFRWEHFAGTSANLRYALFYTSRFSSGYKFNYSNNSYFDNTAGVIRVYDTLTEQSLLAFAVKRQAQQHIVGNNSFGYCAFVYVLSQAYLDQIAQEFPCNAYDHLHDDVADYISHAEETFNLDTDQIRFHNNNRFITFVANAWHLDDSIAYDDFTIPLARNTFVVPNPFIVDGPINLVGEPVIDGSSESGVFIWRTTDGRTLMQAVAGDSAQNGEITEVEGSITSAATISALLPIGLESSDNLVQSAMNRIDFELLTQRPWNDRISFMADVNESLCVNLAAYADGLFLGPDKIKVTPPYDIHGFSGCDDVSIELEGEPIIDDSSESGVFVWRNSSGRYTVRVIAGGAGEMGSPTRFSGSIMSDDSLIRLSGLNLESSDVLMLTTFKQVDFNLLVQRPWYDSFSFSANQAASLCIKLDDYAGGLFLGPNKIKVTPPYDIHDMTGCNNLPIEVNGAPRINQRVDEGWFIWRENGMWYNRFVSGGTTHRFKGSFTSASAMTNLIPISIEANDVLGTLPSTQLNFELTVIDPYLDGFNLNVDADARTCVNLAAPSGVKIFLGPDRVEMPNSFDLTTLQACRSGPDIVKQGKPTIDRTADKGIFVWERANNDWSVEVVTGDTTASVIEVAVISQQLLNKVAPVNLESDDVFTVLPQQLDLSLRVTAPWHDGFEFSAQVQSGTCISSLDPMMPIYLGPDRIQMPQSFDLESLKLCQTGPAITTYGKPTIDPSVDRGIFLWEHNECCINTWNFEVVTGDTTESAIDIDITSKQSVRYSHRGDLESNDKLTALSRYQLQANLIVKAPWHDSFGIEILNNSDTCVSTPTPSMPIYLGPDRVDVGSSINLDTLLSCQ